MDEVPHTLGVCLQCETGAPDGRLRIPCLGAFHAGAHSFTHMDPLAHNLSETKLSTRGTEALRLRAHDLPVGKASREPGREQSRDLGRRPWPLAFCVELSAWSKPIFRQERRYLSEAGGWQMLANKASHHRQKASCLTLRARRNTRFE